MNEPYGIVEKRVMQDPTLSTTAKALYALLATYGVRSYPSVNTICYQLNIVERTARKALNELVQKKAIRVVKNVGKPNTYIVMRK